MKETETEKIYENENRQFSAENNEEIPLSKAIELEAMKAAGMLDERKDGGNAADNTAASREKALELKERELEERERAVRKRELQIKRKAEAQRNRQQAENSRNERRANARGDRLPLTEEELRRIYKDPDALDIYINENDLEDDEDNGYTEEMRRAHREHNRERAVRERRYEDASSRSRRAEGRRQDRPGKSIAENEDSKKARKAQLKKEKRQAEKEAKKREKKERRSQGGRDGGRKKHPFRKLFLILLMIIMIPVIYIVIKFRQMHIGGLSVNDLKDYISEEVKNSASSGAMAGYKNIALFGVDSIEGSLDAGNNRTDIMIIASINEKTGDIKLVSLYRDTYLDIGDGNYQKANAAYAYGGPEQAVKMLNTNLDLNISDYVVTGFEGIATAIDAVGGIDIDVSEEEIHFMNDYQSTMAQETGMTYVPVTQAGLQTLTGLQATAYCRIRYTEGGDFKRTERQKEVLSKTFDKLKSSGPLTMIKVADAVMSKVRTSLNMTEIAALAAKAVNYHIGDTNGIPVEQYRAVGYIGDQSCVIPVHLTDNVVWLHQYLFNDSSYQVSSTVQQISDHVSAVSGR